MRWIIGLIVIMMLLSCGNKHPTDKDKNGVSTTPNAPIDENKYEFNWFKKMADYAGKTVEVYGFMWFDTLTPILPAGNYTVYERPNCYDCGSAAIVAENGPVVTEVEDTNFESTSHGAQWRLVKLTGISKSNKLYIQQIERAEYSYPDYENSGFEMVHSTFLSNQHTGGEHVYMEGILLAASLSFVNGYETTTLKSMDSKTTLTLYLKKGNQANQAEFLINSNQLNIKDKNGLFIKGKKVKVYGIWKNKNAPETVPGTGIIYVEMIEPTS